MTDSSDCESDAGASPSVSSDESATSSSTCSSPGVLKIVTCNVQQQSSTLKRKNSILVNNPVVGGEGCTPVATLGPSSIISEICSTPSSAGRKPTAGKKRICLPVGPVAARNVQRSSTPRGVQCGTNNNRSLYSPISPPADATLKKRKRSASKVTSSPEHSEHFSHNDNGEDLKSSSLSKKRKRNKRRRTRSERNLLARKTTTTMPSTCQAVTEGEEAVALDAEIDRVLEEKAIKNNLSATNVKSLIHHVITNNMVQKMIMSAMKKRTEAGGEDAGRSSDEDGFMEPKMTRAKTKELMGNKNISLWPIVDSPVKISKQPVSETHMLIHHNDLPEDSSGDEEYVPKETDISEIAHSDDESSSITSSHASDIGSPSVPKKHGVSTRRSIMADRSPFIDSMFKTPPPRPNTKALKRNQVNKEDSSAISLRTRSKHPLNDTALEDLERQLVPPDITKDMYDWGTETDNEDYLAFLKDFLNPGQNQNDANEMDDDADPEYNVMEDDEDLHDKEELRMDRAVKVPKKELTQLIAELFESGGILSGDDTEDHDLATLTGITPLANDSGYTDTEGRLGDMSLNSTVQDVPNSSTVDTSVLDVTDDGKEVSISSAVSPSVHQGNITQQQPQSGEDNHVTLQAISSKASDNFQESKTSFTVAPSIKTKTTERPPVVEKNQHLASPGVEETNRVIYHSPPYFRDCDLDLLKHQMRQHVQLLTQSYVLTVSTDDAGMKNIAKVAKGMVIELKNFVNLNGTSSNFSVCNLDSAWTLVNFWPHKYLNQSPIKKKILEEKYISESGIAINQKGQQKGNYFPRHVVKVIAENTAFIYNSLLPECYNQKNAQSRCRFSYSEDALLVEGLDEVKTLKLSASQLADVISDVLLVVHPQSQVYNRIRNLRKSTAVQYCHPDIKKYFTDNVLPLPDRTVPVLTDAHMLPLLQRDKRGLSSLWNSLLLHIEDSSRDKWEEKLNKDPVTKIKTTRRKWKKQSKKKATTASLSSFDSTKFSRSETINRVFPKGALVVDKPNPLMRTIPVMDANGRVGAVIQIPKLALVVHPMSFKLKEGEDDGRAAIKSEHQPQRSCEAQNTGETAAPLSSSNLNLLGLQHLTRKALKAPVKHVSMVNSTQDESLVDQSKITAPTYSVVQVVGRPFDLPELRGASSQVIDISTLQTPMKRKILEKVVEQEQQNKEGIHKESNDDDCKYKEEEEVGIPDSPNVIMEGTEVELTTDDDDDDDNQSLADQLVFNEQPEMITLSSDEEKYSLKPNSIPLDGNNGRGSGGNNSPSKKPDNGGASSKSSCKQGTSSNTTLSSTHVNSTSSSSKDSSNNTLQASGRGDDSDEDGEKRANIDNNKKRPLPKDNYDDEDAHDKGKDKQKLQQTMPVAMQAPPPPPMVHQPSTAHSTQLQPPVVQQQQVCSYLTSSSHTSSSHSSSRQQKKAKRSPVGPTGSKNRVSSKHNVTPPEKMLEESSNEFEDVADAYMESYLSRVQCATETNHPGIYTSFVQMLIDAGDSATVNQSELHIKVKVLFKEYPDLLAEFESFLEPQSSKETTPLTAHETTMAEINLIQMVEKYTENCPALKAKIMNKFKSLKEKPNLREKDIAVVMEPFFTGNPVMMEAFKAILPTVYRPQSLSSGMDFEEIELDMEDPPPHQRGSENNVNSSSNEVYEVVKLPDETQIPATNTCPCVCHTKTGGDVAFTSRSKHCRNCSLKDGKIFIHNGRVMRPVSVELTPAAPAKNPL